MASAMSGQANHPPSHPVAVFVARTRVAIMALQDQPLWTMNDAETRDALIELTRLVAQAEALELRVAAHADRTEVGRASGATSAAVWWSNETHQVQAGAASKMKLAKTLDQHDHIRQALEAGEILLDQARVIIVAVDRLPGDIDPEIRAQARDRLLGAAAHFDAKALRIMGKRILDVVAPEVGEAQEARQLAEEEERAAEAARLTMHDDGEGRTYGRFTLPTWQADILRKHIQALASAKTGGMGLTPHGMGGAFGELITRYPTDRVPQAGGVSATVLVTMTLETLLGGLKAAQLDTGTRISPGLARRLACQAGVIPVVLGGNSQPLDVGRRRRLHTKAQRIAMAIRDGGCVAEGCERPGWMCHAHHVTPWSEGGDTTVKDGVLLCPRHHTLAHDPGFDLTRHPAGKIGFTRRE